MHEIQTTTKQPVLVFRDVSFSYEPGRPVLQKMSFAIQKGESVGLIGANGAGKSTIMKLFPGLLFCSEGEVLSGGLTAKKDNLKDIRKKLGFVLQNSDNQMFMPTVYEDMMFGPLNYMLTREQAEERIDAVLDKLELQDLKYRHNHKLSGGEKRMAAIATVLAMEPEVILMDEPTSALDPFNRRMVINVIRELPQTKLIASHDLDMILDTCDRVLIVSSGRLVADGPAEELLRNRNLLEENRLELPFCLAGR